MISFKFKNLLDTSKISRVQFRSDINGLRAIAVLGVVFYHAEVKFLQGGWLGVDVFFVILKIKINVMLQLTTSYFIQIQII